MAERRLLAAFYLSSPQRHSPDQVSLLAERAGVTQARVAGWDPGDGSLLIGRWGDLQCEVSLENLAYYDLLLITFREDHLRPLWAGATDGVPAPARHVAEVFVSACASLSPVSALATSYAWIDPESYLAGLEDLILGANIATLARNHIWLLYVAAEDVALLADQPPPDVHDVVATPGGSVFIRGLDATA